MRVVTNIWCVAEQIKSDKVENVAMGGVKIGEVGKDCESQKFEDHLESHLEMLGNRRIPKLTRNGEIMTKRNCASRSSKASQDVFVRNT